MQSKVESSLDVLILLNLRWVVLVSAETETEDLRRRVTVHGWTKLRGAPPHLNTTQAQDLLHYRITRVVTRPCNEAVPRNQHY